MEKIDNVIGAEELLQLLKSDKNNYKCGAYLYQLDAMRRQQIYQELESERLYSKHLKIREIFKMVNQDWNQVFLINLLRYLSDEANRANYIEVGLRVNYNIILRERSSLRNIEALLIAASGLVERLPKDIYTMQLRRDVEYMRHKYQIVPLDKKQWSRRGLTPAKEPILRLAQVARLLYENDMIFNKLTNCHTRDDVFNLFNVAAPSEWSRYFGEANVRRIGVAKCDLIGINFVVPMLYAYGYYTSNDDMIAVATNLNESLPAESNRFITKWRGEGLTPTMAYETQALIQLQTIYCKDQQCDKCHVYRQMCSKSSILKDMPIFIEQLRQSRDTQKI